MTNTTLRSEDTEVMAVRDVFGVARQGLLLRVSSKYLTGLVEVVSVKRTRGRYGTTKLGVRSLADQSEHLLDWHDMCGANSTLKLVEFADWASLRALAVEQWLQSPPVLETPVAEVPAEAPAVALENTETLASVSEPVASDESPCEAPVASVEPCEVPEVSEVSETPAE